MNGQFAFNLLDLIGTFVFAISGATAARQRDLDLFGVLAIAFITACGGGIFRDLCIGAIPPAGLADWRYLALAMAAALLTIGAYPLVQRLQQPVLLFDAAGLGLFAVSGAQKAMHFGHAAEVAILLGMITAVGGGMARDVLLNRVAVVLRKEIYASAALLGAAVAVAGAHYQWPAATSTWLPILACFSLRYLSLRYHWNLPRFRPDPRDKQEAAE
jgi:uncharacterized membrane protein YeiH